MATMGNILRELRKSQDAAGANVMVTAQHAPASRLQSLIASGEAAQLKFEPLPTGGLEAKFDTRDWFGWATVAWAKLKHLKPHPMLRPTDNRPQPFPNTARVGVIGDWGTGLYGAPLPAPDGAPIRLVVPWKYGFKGIKAIAKIELTDQRPGTFWSEIAPNEYGFYANVNPNVPHPRWLQNMERRIGELSMRPTLMFNGYGEQVAYLYKGMDLKGSY